MTNRTKLLIAIMGLTAFFTLLPHSRVWCNQVNYSYKQIAIREGLSQSTVSSILRDRHGIVWIGTRSGLNSFDKGDTRVYFNHRDDPTSIPGNRIFSLFQDSLQNIWVGTNGGLALYNNRNDNFATILNEIVYCAIDIPGGMLFGGANAIYRYQYTDGSMEIIPIRPKGSLQDANDYRVVKMQKKGKEVVLATNQKGLYSYSPHSRELSKLPVPDIQTLLTMHIGADGLFYISSFKNGLFCYAPDGSSVSHYHTGNSGLNNNIVMSIVERGDHLWLGTDGGGISILSRFTGDIHSIQHEPGNPHSLPVNSVTVLYIDNDSNLWAGTVRGGVLSIKEAFIRTYADVTIGSPNGITEKVVISLFEDSEQRLWIGTDGGGINMYDPHLHRFRHYPSTYGDKVISITDLSESRLLVSIFDKGIFVFDKNTGSYRPFVIADPETDAAEKRSDFMPLVYRVGPDKIYILSEHAYIYHPSSGRFSSISVPQNEVVSGALNLVYSDSVRSLAFAGNRIFDIAQRNDVPHTILTMGDTEVIYSVCYTDDGNLWIGSDYGLSRYNIQRNEFSRVETSLFKSVSHMLLQGQERLWICAHNMLFSYDPDRERFLVWGDADGFVPNEILFMYQAPSLSDNLYLGGTNGLVVIDSQISSERDFPPQITLRDVLLNGRSASANIRNKTIHIPYNYSSLAVKVDSYEKDMFRSTLFRYHIAGQNRKFIETYDRTLNMSSLAPGVYNIAVSCNTKGGEWLAPVTLLQINVNPPWYGTWWSILAYIVFIGGVLISVIWTVLRKNENRLRWKMTEYEQQINESKIQFLVNVSHELRTPLTLIYAPMKRIIKRLDHDDPLAENLGDIYRQAGQMKDLINMVLDINKMESGGMKLDLSNLDLNSWVEAIARDFGREYEEKDILLTVRTDENIGNISFDESKCKIILSNLLMNALKFSHTATEVVLSTELKEGRVRISVSDEGIGLQNLNHEKLFTRFYQGGHSKKGSGIGLSYAKQLIERHGGTIDAFDNPSGGATFYFELPVSLSVVVAGDAVEPVSMVMQSHDDKPDSNLLGAHSVLVVEDNRDFRNFLKKVLKEYFKSVYTAEDGAEALEMIKNRRPDLVVSDVMMPRMDGYEMCRRIKEDIEISHIPVILLTARGDSESIATGYKLGADFYLSKPFEVDILLTILHNQLRSQERFRRFYREASGPVPPLESTISFADEQFMVSLNRFIVENLDKQSLNANYLARELAMGRTSLYNKVKVLTGMGVNDYINKLRIDKACELLMQTDLNVTEIAYEVGYLYQRYFSTLFKQLKGMPPTQYREQNRPTPQNGAGNIESD